MRETTERVKEIEKFVYERKERGGGKERYVDM